MQAGGDLALLHLDLGELHFGNSLGVRVLGHQNWQSHRKVVLGLEIAALLIGPVG